MHKGMFESSAVIKDFLLHGNGIVFHYPFCCFGEQEELPAANKPYRGRKPYSS